MRHEKTTNYKQFLPMLCTILFWFFGLIIFGMLAKIMTNLPNLLLEMQFKIRSFVDRPLNELFWQGCVWRSYVSIYYVYLNCGISNILMILMSGLYLYPVLNVQHKFMWWEFTRVHVTSLKIKAKNPLTIMSIFILANNEMWLHVPFLLTPIPSMRYPTCAHFGVPQSNSLLKFMCLTTLPPSFKSCGFTAWPLNEYIQLLAHL